MTSEEFKILAAGLKAAYPNQTFLQDDYSMKLWYRLLQDIDYDLVETAAYKHICTSKFPPSIAEIREACQNVSAGNTRSWLEGWGQLRKTMGKYGYNRPKEAIEEITKFDPIAGKVASLLGWQRLCESEDLTADRANFRKSYEAIQERDIERAKMPPTVSRRIDSLTKHFAMRGKSVAKLPPVQP